MAICNEDKAISSVTPLPVTFETEYPVIARLAWLCGWLAFWPFRKIYRGSIK